MTGATGSGKTAILTALLGEMELLEGKSYLPKDTMTVDKDTGLRNSVAYASQTPWLQQLSIKNNILFGEEYDEARYEATLDACALSVWLSTQRLVADKQDPRSGNPRRRRSDGDWSERRVFEVSDGHVWRGSSS